MFVATGAAGVLEAGSLKDAFVAALAGAGGWFNATSCASLIGSSSSKRTTSTFTGGAAGLSALVGKVAAAGSACVVPGGGEALAREGVGAGGGDVEAANDLGAAATIGVWLVLGAKDAGRLVCAASRAGRFVAMA